METVAVIVPTFGDRDKWDKISTRAIASAWLAAPTTVVHEHADNLAQARNRGAARAHADWLIFLDADDELDNDYVAHMIQSNGDVRQPSTLGVIDSVEDDYPVLIPPHPGGFLVGNHLVIGCMVRRKLFLDVGGFRDLPILEDWDLWIRCILHDGKIGTAPDAIYRVNVSPGSRNQQNNHGRTYTEIQNHYIHEWRAKGFK